MAEFILEVGLVILWILTLVFSVVSLVVKLISKAAHKHSPQKQKTDRLGHWSNASCFLQLVSPVLLVLVAAMASSYYSSSAYTWIFAVFGLIAVLMIILAVHGLYRILLFKKVIHIFCSHSGHSSMAPI